MKAVLCKQYGPPESLSIEEVESPKAGKGQAVISVKACGVNFPDTLIIQGRYQYRPAMPFSPGGEVAGIVKEVGEGVHQVRAGDKVIAFTGWGGFAEEVGADAKILIPMPEGMDFITAASFVMTFGTSHYAEHLAEFLAPRLVLLDKTRDKRKVAHVSAGRAGDHHGWGSGQWLAALRIGRLSAPSQTSRSRFPGA